MKVGCEIPEIKSLTVKYRGKRVGKLAATAKGSIAFAYEDSWLENGFAISPFSLPLEKRVFVPEKKCFTGLFGIFADSLPDAWGKLLLDRVLKKSAIEENISSLKRLSLVGNSGMGALEYEPSWALAKEHNVDDIDLIAAQCEKVLKSIPMQEVDKLYMLAGSSGGARPKIFMEHEGKEWMVKFPASVDERDKGEQEYQYMKCARKCGITIPEVGLFESTKCSGYLGIVRFDRSDEDGRKVKRHMATAAALLEADFRTPCMDYHTLMKLTSIVTEENENDIENMFRRACFNVFAHNRDDHAKNFTFIFDERESRWRLAPAYDLTYSDTYYGEHTTSVDGNGLNPGKNELVKVGVKAGMSKSKCSEIADQIRDIVNEDLGKKWLKRGLSVDEKRLKKKNSAYR